MPSRSPFRFAVAAVPLLAIFLATIVIGTTARAQEASPHPLRFEQSTEHLAGIAVREPMVVRHPSGALFVAGYTRDVAESNAAPKLFRSDDGGTSWSRVDVGTPEEGALGNSDVDLAVGPDGTLYFLTMGFDRSTGRGTHVAVGVSHDVGASWAWNRLSETDLDDRPWIVVTLDGVAHVIWNDDDGVAHAIGTDAGSEWRETDRVHPAGGSSHLAVGPNGELAVRITPIAASGNSFDEGVDLIAVSLDGGSSWNKSTPPGDRHWGAGPSRAQALPRWVEPVAFDEEGALYYLWSEGEELWLARSSDRAGSWSSWRVDAGAEPRFYPYLIARGAGELAATWFSGGEQELHAHVARIDLTRHRPLMHRAEAFQPNSWSATGDTRHRDAAGEYLPVMFLPDGDLGVVAPIQNERDGRLGFTWHRITGPVRR